MMSQAVFRYLPVGEDAADLAQRLAACTPWLASDDDVLALLERAERIFFGKYSEIDDAALWSEGRLFGAVGELRWWREEELIHLVLVTDREDALPPVFTDAEADAALTLVAVTPPPLAEVDLDLVYLWGEETEQGDWRDGRLPDPIVYPVVGRGKAGSRVRLQVRRYRAHTSQTDAVDFVRYVRLHVDAPADTPIDAPDMENMS